MINITKDQADLVKKYFPYVHIMRTTHKYYMEENSKAVNFIKNLSNDRGNRNGDRTSSGRK